MSHHMRIRSIFLWLIIYTSFESNASNEVIEFGFKTSDGAQSHSPNPIVLTLWFNTTIYQGTTPAPTASTWYTLSMQNEPYFNIIGRNCSNITQPKVMFQLDHPDAVCVDRTRVVTQSGDWYGIDKVYKYDSPSVFCVDNQDPVEWTNGFGPFKQIIYFDTTRPNVFINDSAWREGTNADPRSNTYQCDRIPSQLTDEYGSGGGNLYSVLDQGRVYAMLNWGLESSKYLQIRGWKADSQTTSTDYGVGTSRSPCTSFTLSSDDYITGYQIWNDAIGISGLKFWTRHDRTLSCIGISDHTTTSYTNSYDYGTFNFSYLTGWNVWSGARIDRIQFQFTESLLTGAPTQVTSMPSVSPSEVPTAPTYIPSQIPSSNPSQTPSSNPSQVPSVSPSEIPTLPTYLPTYFPTYNTNNPSQVPSSNPTGLPTFSTNNPSNAPSQTPSSIPTQVPSFKPMHNIMETERNEGSSNASNSNKDTIPMEAVIVFVLASFSVCTMIAICVYIKKHNIMIPIVRVTSVDIEVENQPGSGPKLIKAEQNRNQIEKELQFEPKVEILQMTVEGNILEAQDQNKTRDYANDINIGDDEFVIEADDDGHDTVS
eukprot:33237_1